MSLENLRYFLEWLSNNHLTVVLVLYALVPILALAVLGYMVYVLSKSIERKK